MSYKFFTYVWLFTEQESEELPTPIEYEINREELNLLQVAIKEGAQLIPFGDTYHHIDDIIKLQIKR
ncbi:hypothetical protein BpsS36_00034 [Bacillus phage vB_BpsS-36]|uniref:Uncharacterized protein n=1 Tax=Bacillus phage vB_BpsS-36 TaxID=2419622 RepID=A0A3G3BX38_9CAUD|nr:hypothetical protein BpsS36_00034 [Bacillus phage vB_BpsS-36]